jgi:hypothetical protein
MKLQSIIDAAFGAPDRPSPVQEPSEQSRERDRAFSELARKTEALRQERMAAGPEAAAAPLVFEVIRYRGHWRTQHASKRSAAYESQAAAILAARKLAIAKRNAGNEVKVILQRTDGTAVVQPIDEAAQP